MGRQPHRATRRWSACLLVAAVLAALLPSSALAASLTVRDATGDMWTLEEGATRGEPAPDARIGDFVRTTVRHTASRVVVRTRFVELAPVGRRFTLWVGMRSGDGRETTLGVRATRGDRDGFTILMNAHGKDIRCDVRHRISYSRHLVRAVVPRACLGDPSSLRFTVLSEQWGRRLFFSNLDDGLTPRQPGRIHWSSPVRSG